MKGGVGFLTPPFLLWSIMAIQSALTELNKRTAKDVVSLLKKMVVSMTDFAKRPYSTIMHPRGGRSAQSRLNDTGRFASNWAMVEYASSMGFAIRPSTAVHSGNTTYADIVRYNDKNDNYNKHIDNPPELTPSSKQQIEEQQWFRDYVNEMGELLNKESGEVAKVVELKIGA